MKNRKKILVTCPPMLGMMNHLQSFFDSLGVEVHCPEVVQTLTEDELIELVPSYDGWIIGDDPATRGVLKAGKNGRLKAAVKWGIGVDNVDFIACKELGIPIANTPMMFGKEVADLAMSYITALARGTFMIDREIRKGGWPKPRGISLAGRTVGLVGFGDIGVNTAERMLSADMEVIAFDPVYEPAESLATVQHANWPDRIGECDFIVFTCSLNESNRKMLNPNILRFVKKGVRIVNVARGQLIDQAALIDGLESGDVHSVALDVFEVEPLPENSALREYEQCIFGAHNGSNTSDAVLRASERAIELLFEFLEIDGNDE